MTEIAMFPLGTVLFPYMPLPLRIFEERYLVMLSRILEHEPSSFGVALIERGQESGGGGTTFPIGTMAQITEIEAAEGFIALMTEGFQRFEIVEWQADDPHPNAEVRLLDELEWDESLEPLRARAEQLVRSTLALASEFDDQQWSATVEFAQLPIAACWQLAAVAPLQQLDQLTLLQCTSARELLETTIELTLAVAETLVHLAHEQP